MKKKLRLFLIVLLLIASLVVLTACNDDEDYDDDEEEKESAVVDKVETETPSMTEEEAEELLEEYYGIAESLYFLSDDYFDIDFEGDGSEYLTKYLISNYEEVIHNYISKDFQKTFYPALLEKENGQYYLGIGGFAEGYENLRFENIEIEEGKISCTVVLDLYVAGDELLGKDLESDFAIVSENGTWKIDEYTSFNALRY